MMAGREAAIARYNGGGDYELDPLTTSVDAQ